MKSGKNQKFRRSEQQGKLTSDHPRAEARGVSRLRLGSLVRNSAFALWNSSLRLSAGHPSEANAEWTEFTCTKRHELFCVSSA